MQIVIDIPEYIIEDMKECGFIPDEDNEELCKAIDNGTPIPDNATNGDMIKTIFDPETSLGIRLHCAHFWWNAPYQKGGK